MSISADARTSELQIFMAASVVQTNVMPGGNGNALLEQKSVLTLLATRHVDPNRILPLKDHVNSQKHTESFENRSLELCERALETLKQKIVGKKGIDDFLLSVANDLSEEKFFRLVEILKLGVNKDDAMQFLGYLESIVTHPRFPYHRRDITIEFLEKPEFARFLDDQVAGHFARSEPHLAQAFIEILGKEIGKELLEIVGKASKEKNNEDAQLEFHTLYVLSLLVTDYAERYKKVQEMKAAALRNGNGSAASF